MNKAFRKFASVVSNAAGNSGTFLLALLIVTCWAVTGPVFNFSNTWQLVINTGTTIVTFLMVFLIQNTQNRDSKAMQLKLDELIRASKARDVFIDLEDLSDEDLATVSKEFEVFSRSSANPAVLKMHAKIEAAHHRRKAASRQNLVQQAGHVAGQVAGQVIEVLGHLSTSKDDTDKK